MILWQLLDCFVVIIDNDSCCFEPRQILLVFTSKSVLDLNCPRDDSSRRILDRIDNLLKLVNGHLEDRCELIQGKLFAEICLELRILLFVPLVIPFPLSPHDFDSI